MQNVKKYFPIKTNMFSSFNLGKRNYKKVLDGVSLLIPEGRVSVLVGESGSGKTTLARIIFYKQYSKEQRIKKILTVLDEVYLKPSSEFAEKYPHMLSGGERQRVAIARSLVIEPKLIIADEPVSMLDVSIRAQILDILRQLSIKRKITIFYITHDLITSRYIGDEISVMYAGNIVETGPINEVLSNPLHPYTQGLLDAVSEPKFENIDKEKIIRIKNFDSIASESGCKFINKCPYSMDICKNEPKLKRIEKNHNVSCFIYDKK